MSIFIVATIAALLITVIWRVRIPSLSIPLNAATDKKLDALNKWLDHVYAKNKFNGTILLSKGGKVIFSRSYGVDSAEGTNQLTEYSSFNLASASKQFTAMGIVILNHQSKIAYEDKLADYIPELAFYGDITISQLLHHTSGLPDYMRLAGKTLNGKAREDSTPFTTAEMISLFGEHKPNLSFKPGSKFRYSNTGYVLLAEVIQRVSGQSFQGFMATHVFEPLKMNDTQVFNLLSEPPPSKRVFGFKRKMGGKRVARDLNYLDGVAGDGAVYSSAHDLNLWHKALTNNSLVPNQAYKRAYVPAQLNDGSNVEYGFGWLINNDGSVEHSGGWQGFTSFIYRSLENDDLIVVLDNSSNALRATANGFRFHSIGLNLKHFMESFEST
jgi:CubicO group peptidase (beta-lactamase class C family)